MSLFAARPNPAHIERLTQLEKQIEPGLAATKIFTTAGQALAAIRDEKLFSHKWPNFSAYLQDRWHISERHANRLIDAAALVLQLGDRGAQVTTESQARVLAQVPPENRPAVLDAASLDQTGLTLGKLEAAAAPFRKPRRKVKRAKRAKIVRIKTAGGLVIVRPARAFQTAEQCLVEALSVVQKATTQATRAA